MTLLKADIWHINSYTCNSEVLKLSARKNIPFKTLYSLKKTERIAHFSQYTVPHEWNSLSSRKFQNVLVTRIAIHVPDISFE